MAYPVASRPSADARARQLSKDIAFVRGDYVANASHDWSTVQGLDALRQAVMNRLITSPGEYAARPDYGVGILDFLKEELTESRMAELVTRIRTQLLQDRRITKVDVLLEEFAAPGTGLRVSLVVVAAGQPVTLAPFSFTSDGVNP